MWAIMHSTIVQQQNTLQKVKTFAGAVIIMFPVLGLTWVFAFMTINRETLFFRYLFVIYNPFQGCMIFIFHCLQNKEVKQEWSYDCTYMKYIVVMIPFFLVKRSWTIFLKYWIERRKAQRLRHTDCYC